MARKNLYNIAIAGATGVVGREFLKILEQRDFPVGKIKLLASERSLGAKLVFKGEELPVENLEEADFKGIHIGLFSPGASVSRVHAPRAAKAGTIVIDNTSEFRMYKEIPLVVPEVNPEDIALYRNRNIIANPNCSTIQMVVALKPIHDRFRIKRVVVSTYQSVSGAGKDAMEELSNQVKALFNMKSAEAKAFPHRIAFNCLPQIDSFLPDGYTKEEMKMVSETKKIMHDDSIKITATTVRVPVFVGHSESVNIETEKEISPDAVRKALKKAPGITLADDPANAVYPMPVDAQDEDNVFVGRIRRDDTIQNGINMWIVADNLRKGAALNAIQIAEILVEKYI